MERVGDSGGSPVRRGRPKAMPDADRRQAILDAAYAVFLELGFAKTTTAAVAAKAKTSKRLIYDLFADKTELFAAVIAEHRHLVLDLPPPEGEAGSALEMLVRIFRLDIDAEAARERDAVLSLIVRESVLSPALSAFLYDHKLISFRDDLIEWLEAARLEGLIAFDDVEVVAGMMMDIVFGALLPRRQLRGTVERDLSISHIKKRLEILLRGVSSGPTTG